MVRKGVEIIRLFLSGITQQWRSMTLQLNARTSSWQFQFPLQYNVFVDAVILVPKTLRRKLSYLNLLNHEVYPSKIQIFSFCLTDNAAPKTSVTAIKHISTLWKNAYCFNVKADDKYNSRCNVKAKLTYRYVGWLRSLISVGVRSRFTNFPWTIITVSVYVVAVVVGFICINRSCWLLLFDASFHKHTARTRKQAGRC